MELITNQIDKSRALDIIVKAYALSTEMSWIVAKFRSNSALRYFFDISYRDALINNGVFLTSDRNGVVFFYRLQNKKISWNNFSRKIYAFFFLTGIRIGIKVINCKKIINKIRPKEGWVGILIATDMDAFGKAAVLEIKKETYRLADEKNEPIYLETTSPKAMRLYKSAGFIEYNQMKHPYEDLTVWFLVREPSRLRKNQLLNQSKITYL